MEELLKQILAAQHETNEKLDVLIKQTDAQHVRLEQIDNWRSVLASQLGFLALKASDPEGF